MNSALADLALDPQTAAFLVIDVQERLATAMPDEALARAERNIAILAELARRFAIPAVVSRQYPKGLGDTTEPVRAALEPLEGSVHRFDKVDFSVCDAPEFEAIWQRLGRRQWIVTGMETHVCVYQSARQLLARGAAVHVVSDAVCSRTSANYEVGLELMRRAGAIITSTEVVAFDVLRRAGSDDFKALSRLIK